MEFIALPPNDLYRRIQDQPGRAAKPGQACAEKVVSWTASPSRTPHTGVENTRNLTCITFSMSQTITNARQAEWMGDRVQAGKRISASAMRAFQSSIM